MLNLNRTVMASGLTLGALVFAGCGPSELGPADPSKVPAVDPGVIQKEINNPESQKHLPKGAKIPANVMPQDQSKK
ncbi:MAG: hypothetical protein FJ302_08045 [Planctomycetes bacterium]|nr:hypothetical protein [Planctomycetota bacterium]